MLALHLPSGPYLFFFFVENDITGDILCQADHALLKQLRVNSVGHRIMILRAINNYRANSGEDMDFADGE